MAFIALLLILMSIIGFIKNSNDYQNEVLASSMKKGEVLPQYGQNLQAELKLGNMKLSRDGKTLAVEIKYDRDAHTRLSSFGDRYTINLFTTPENPMKGVKIQYGMFGTDGSGVLILKSVKGFEAKAFMVMLTDKNHLVTASDLSGTGVSVSDEDITKSLTAQLSNADEETQVSDASASSSADKEKSKLPPTWGVRINAATATKSSMNWNNDSELVEDLFVRDNLQKIKKSITKFGEKIEKADNTIDEMKKRIAKNPEDELSVQNMQDLTSSVDMLKSDLATEKENYNRISNGVIKRNILNPKQTKYFVKVMENITFKPNED